MKKLIKLILLGMAATLIILLISNIALASNQFDTGTFLVASPNESIPGSVGSINNAANLDTLRDGEIFWLLIIAILGPQVVILCVFLGPFWSGENLGERAKYLSEVLPRVIEGTTILLVISTIIFMGLLKINLTEGSLSLLSAIAGYVLGKGQSSVMQNKKLESTIGQSQAEGQIDK